MVDEKKLLMELQYRFPLTPTPYSDVAARLGADEEEVLEILRTLSAKGIVKRIGYYFNVKSIGVRPVLLAIEADEDRVRSIVSRLDNVTHAYKREHPVYNIWLVVRVRELEEVYKLVEKLGASKWAVFPSTRTYKLSVKYDLYEGVSRSGPYSIVKPNPPPPEEFGIPRHIARKLVKLPLARRPYSEIAKTLETSETSLIETIKAMLDKGTLLDPGLALDGHKLGFTSNAMTILDADPSICECISLSQYTTHVVEREVYPENARREWGNKLCYFMVHGVSRAKCLSAVKSVLNRCGAEARYVLFSLADLKPGFTR